MQDDNCNTYDKYMIAEQTRNIYENDSQSIVKLINSIAQNETSSAALGEINQDDLESQYVSLLLLDSYEYLKLTTEFFHGNFIVSLLKLHHQYSFEKKQDDLEDNILGAVNQKIIFNKELDSETKVTQISHIMHYLNRWTIIRPEVESILYQKLIPLIQAQSRDEPDILKYADKFPRGIFKPTAKERVVTLLGAGREATTSLISSLTWGFSSLRSAIINFNAQPVEDTKSIEQNMAEAGKYAKEFRQSKLIPHEAVKQAVKQVNSEIEDIKVRRRLPARLR